MAYIDISHRLDLKGLADDFMWSDLPDDKLLEFILLLDAGRADMVFTLKLIKKLKETLKDGN